MQNSNVKNIEFFFKDYDSKIKNMQEAYVANLHADLYQIVKKIVETRKSKRLVIESEDNSTTEVGSDMKVYTLYDDESKQVMGFRDYFEGNIKTVDDARNLYKKIMEDEEVKKILQN